jgi:DNA-binding FadR family transcriptional regulator
LHLQQFLHPMMAYVQGNEQRSKVRPGERDGQACDDHGRLLAVVQRGDDEHASARGDPMGEQSRTEAAKGTHCRPVLAAF